MRQGQSHPQLSISSRQTSSSGRPPRRRGPCRQSVSNYLSVRVFPWKILFHASSQNHHAFSFDRAWLSMTPSWRLLPSAGRDSTTAVVLFNTGLALHLQGRRNICLQQTSLKKALQLYTMAVNILEKMARLRRRRRSQPSCILPRLTTWVTSTHFCEGKAQHCLQLLFATLVTVKSSGIDIYSDDYRPFTMNALILWGQKSRRPQHSIVTSS
jgi:hypothetical protein